MVDVALAAGKVGRLEFSDVSRRFRHIVVQEQQRGLVSAFRILWKTHFEVGWFLLALFLRKRRWRRRSVGRFFFGSRLFLFVQETRVVRDFLTRLRDLLVHQLQAVANLGF